MDTAQRNMGLDWPATQELITRSSALAREHGARIASGAGTDHLVGPAGGLSAVTQAYLEQVEFVEGAGSQVIVMASRHLAAVARSAEDYLSVYARVLSQASRPVILHWLGEMFDPQLSGYWGSADIATATRTFLDLVHEHAAKVDGVKVSLLSAEHEQELRAVLPSGVRLYTGDDFNYPELIEGDGEHHSDALLGAFAAIAPAAAAALAALDDDDVETYRREMAPTVALSRHLFATPTYYYKTGHRLSGLAERTPGRIRHGRWPAVRTVGRAPGPGVRAGQRGAAARRPGAGGPPPRAAAGDGRPGPMTGSSTGSRSISGRPPRGRCPRRSRAASTPGWARSASGASSSPRSASTRAVRLVAESGLRVSSLCRGGFFTTADPAEAQAAEANNRAALEEAAALGAATLVLVPGGLPAGDRDLVGARDRAARAIERLVPYAAGARRDRWASSR